MLLIALLTPLLAAALVCADLESRDTSTPALTRPGPGCDIQCIRAPCPVKPWCCSATHSCTPPSRCIRRDGGYRCCPPGQWCRRDPITWPGEPVARDEERAGNRAGAPWAAGRAVTSVSEGLNTLARKQRSVERGFKSVREGGKDLPGKRGAGEERSMKVVGEAAEALARKPRSVDVHQDENGSR